LSFADFLVIVASLLFADGLGSNLVSVLFPEVCGTSLDSHHGYIVEYGKDRDVDLGKYWEWSLLGSS